MLAVKEFLRLEVRLSTDTIEKMEMDKIFATAGREDPQWLYVTFKHQSSVQRIYEKTRIMRKESRIITYIPKEFHSRFEVIRDIGTELRLREKCNTRIKMGFMDLQLFRKEKGRGKWYEVQLPTDIPPVELGMVSRRVVFESPAPGRPGQSRTDNGNHTERNDAAAAANEEQEKDKSILDDSEASQKKQ